MRLSSLSALAVLLLPAVAHAQTSFPAEAPITVEKSANARQPAPSLEVPVRRATQVPRAAVAAPAPESAGAVGLQPGAAFRNGDSFELRLSGMPVDDSAQFNQAFTISSDGLVSIPLAGQVRAAGLTQGQLERAIERKLVEEQIFRFPTATINVAPQTRFVTVGGSVRAPSRYTWSSDLTLLSALAAAGGPGDFGGDKVELVRGGKMTVFSIKKLKKDPTQDPRIMPGDQIELR